MGLTPYLHIYMGATNFFNHNCGDVHEWSKIFTKILIFGIELLWYFVNLFFAPLTAVLVTSI